MLYVVSMNKFTTDQIIGELRKHGKTLADIGRQQNPPVTRQYVWQVVHGERQGENTNIKQDIAKIMEREVTEIFN